MATLKWIAGAGQGLTWGALMGGSDPNSIVSGNAILSSTQIDNSSALDLFMDISVSLGSVTPGSGAPYIGMYLVPLNEDGSSYGDGRFGSSAAGPPASSYFVGPIPCVASTAGVITGAIQGVRLPPGRFKVILYNLSGVTLASSANVVDYRTYDLATS